MRKILLVLIIVTSIVACSKDSGVTPTQNIITSDSSLTTGRLIAKVYSNGGTLTANADVYLYTSYDDLERDIPILNLQTTGNGEADFGYVLIGNYYLRAFKAGMSDTVAAQVLSQRTVVRT